jgi:hypothetical protein
MLFVQRAQLFGHRVICITSRTNPNKSLVTDELPSGVDAYFALNVPKKQFAETLGIKVDVWIDDDPKTIDPASYEGRIENS